MTDSKSESMRTKVPAGTAGCYPTDAQVAAPVSGEVADEPKARLGGKAWKLLEARTIANADFIAAANPAAILELIALASQPVAALPTEPVILHVRDFGVVGDGVTDDTAAFQAAVDAVAALPAEQVPTELPPLPACKMLSGRNLDSLHVLYSADQMKDYAGAALAARQAPTEQPIAWAAESNIGGGMRVITKFTATEAEIDRYVNAEQARLAGCNRVKVPLYLAARQVVAPEASRGLPKWIDNLKGSDPTIDGLIEYIERMDGAVERDAGRDAK